MNSCFFQGQGNRDYFLQTGKLQNNRPTGTLLVEQSTTLTYTAKSQLQTTGVHPVAKLTQICHSLPQIPIPVRLTISNTNGVVIRLVQEVTENIGEPA
ncbi:MAG: hypothetical protein HWQ35_05770 [Nostoc sp. NMS1]|uniref:hypothetical protein n=1 Tax=unclassified Nostoc TaxID=2593658 RepID=UPI0025DDAA88|nr:MULTISPECIES: hypothetical protein [unclassified Nostoc]MBN3906070.1 hypothetical protein [Nostoc sp. NMS1]MBN3992710.1 hypothetical protein [Nostoc sp. NMS2]